MKTLQLLSAGPRRQASARTSAESDEACQRKTKDRADGMCVCVTMKKSARRMASTTSDTGDTSSKQQQAQRKENYNKMCVCVCVCVRVRACVCQRKTKDCVCTHNFVHFIKHYWVYSQQMPHRHFYYFLAKRCRRYQQSLCTQGMHSQRRHHCLLHQKENCPEACFKRQKTFSYLLQTTETSQARNCVSLHKDIATGQ